MFDVQISKMTESRENKGIHNDKVWCSAKKSMCLPVYPGNGKQTVINTYTLIPMHTYSFQTQFGIQFECNKLCFENKNLMILVLDGFILYFFFYLNTK